VRIRVHVAWPFTLVVLVAACGSDGSAMGGAGTGTGGGGSGNVSGGGTGASSSGGSGNGGTSSGGSGAAPGGGTSGGGTSSAGTGGVDAGPEIQGGACVEPIGAPPSPACAQGQPVQSYCNLAQPSELVMATCQSHGKTQCEAGEACAAGWHFCTGSEYLARGGRTIPKASTIIYAWVGACVRDATGNKLKDGPCSICDTDVGASPGMIYGCNGESISPGMIDDTIGAMADTTCHRIGENIPANTGFWSINWSGHMAGHTLCCIDTP
jgi:hypothetical protein